MVCFRSKLIALKGFFDWNDFRHLFCTKTARRLIYLWALDPVVCKFFHNIKLQSLDRYCNLRYSMKVIFKIIQINKVLILLFQPENNKKSSHNSTKFIKKTRFRKKYFIFCTFFGKFPIFGLYNWFISNRYFSQQVS